jgi:LacI family transcriptional regulator
MPAAVAKSMTTLDQIAIEAGVSKITVSRVLTGKGKGVRTGAKERAGRIRAIAHRLGYRPNVAARIFSTGRFGSITMVTSIDSQRVFLPEALLRGIDDVLCERDMHLSLARVPVDKLTSEEQLPKVIRELASDGLLMNYPSDVSPVVRQILKRFKIPHVWVNTKVDRDAVYPDDLRAGREACEYLLKLGHKRIAYVNYGRGKHYSEIDRQAGYESAMKSAKLAPQVYWIPLEFRDRQYDDRITVSRGLLTAARRPTAVICYAPDYALPIYEAARDMSLRVPDDLSIITFNPEYLMNLTGVAFTTMATPELTQGRVAVQMLLDKIDRGNPSVPSKMLPSRLIEGRTCGPLERG